MKYIHKLSVRILVAIVIGLFFAGTGTSITYTCAPVDGAKGCISFDKAVMHPGDLLNNKQNSLTHFSEIFVISSVVSFAVLSIVDSVQKKPKPATQPKN